VAPALAQTDPVLDVSAAAGIVRAAGGVFVRRDASSGELVLLVHRPKYDDWTFPKGKNLAGESDRDAAVREVLEETGLRARAGREVARTRYRDRFGRDKEAVYYAMTEDGDEEFVPGDEVDEIRWVSADEAASLLTYPRDVGVLKAALGR
jgi:8-oxo-dGTP pyrophosphatase MutT (NUDIX family)